jgi:beta-phosphoglucomutase-like phosphatase (HAD superfamily)
MPRLKAQDKRHAAQAPPPLPGAVELLRFMRQTRIILGIATSSQNPHINSPLEALGVTQDTLVVERGDVARAKPERASSSRASSAWAWRSRTAAWSGT